MAKSEIGRRGACLGLVSLPALSGGFALADDNDGGNPARPGQLLIASPEITDPRFVKTVILMVQHDSDGALGIVINRPIEERTLASLLDAIGEDSAGVSGTVRVFETPQVTGSKTPGKYKE